VNPCAKSHAAPRQRGARYTSVWAQSPSTGRMWRALEPAHTVTYFAPESQGACEVLGTQGLLASYFALRAAPLGAPPVERPGVALGQLLDDVREVRDAEADGAAWDSRLSGSGSRCCGARVLRGLGQRRPRCCNPVPRRRAGPGALPHGEAHRQGPEAGAARHRAGRRERRERSTGARRT
jgi:hypothetical protein